MGASRGSQVQAATADAAAISIAPVVAAILPAVRRDVAEHYRLSSLVLEPASFEDRRFSYLLKARVRSGTSGGGPSVYVKVFKAASGAEAEARMRARVEHDYASTRRAFEHMRDRPGLGVVRPVACYPDSLASVTEESPGETMLSRLERTAGGYPDAAVLTGLRSAVARIGSWVRAYQSMDVGGETEAVRATREYIDVRLRKLVAAPRARFGERDRSRVLDHIDRLAADAGANGLPQVAVHGDLALANILVDGERIVVLDFAMAGRGPAFVDLSRVFLQLDLLCAKPRFRPRTIRALQAALLSGYDPALDAGFPLFRLALLRHHVNHLTTLSARAEPFPASLYNWLVRRRHRRWIADELASGMRGGSA